MPPDGHDDASTFCRRLERLLGQQRHLLHSAKLFVTARARGWHLAARRLHDQSLQQARSLRQALDEFLQCQEPASATPPISATALLQDLRQLDEEFDDLQVDPAESTVSVTTEPLTLADVALGRFRIVLHLPRLSRRQQPDSSAFDCLALEPNPPPASSGTTHPHVQGEQLCAGEAAAALRLALGQGRLFDAFALVRSVLRTYNPDSAYVSLDNWHGQPCGDCGRSSDPDEMGYCRSCEIDLCDRCAGSCDACGETHCLGCLEPDRDDGAQLCSGCRGTCPQCGGITTIKQIEQLGLCPGCFEDQEPEDPDEQEHEHEHERDQVNERQTAPTTADVAAPDTTHPAVLTDGLA